MCIIWCKYFYKRTHYFHSEQQWSGFFTLHTLHKSTDNDDTNNVKWTQKNVFRLMMRRRRRHYRAVAAAVVDVDDMRSSHTYALRWFVDCVVVVRAVLRSVWVPLAHFLALRCANSAAATAGVRRGRNERDRLRTAIWWMEEEEAAAGSDKRRRGERLKIFWWKKLSNRRGAWLSSGLWTEASARRPTKWTDSMRASECSVLFALRCGCCQALHCTWQRESEKCVCETTTPRHK